MKSGAAMYATASFMMALVDIVVEGVKVVMNIVIISWELISNQRCR